MKNAISKGTTKLKSFIQPMLVKVSDAKPFNDPNWIFEIKPSFAKSFGGQVGWDITFLQ
jgi:hypothetical protein